MGKYFTVEVKPTIPTIETTGMHSGFSANDIVFDWFPFDIPRGTSLLQSVLLEIAPEHDSGASVNEIKLDLIFAKTVNGQAPTSLGTANSALTADVNSRNEIIGYISNAVFAFETHLDSTAIALARSGMSGNILFEGEPDSGVNVGFDKIYVAAISSGSLDLRSTMQINNGTLDGDTFTVDGVDPRKCLKPGDIIAATTTADTSVSKSLGTVKSLTDTTITLESTTENAVLDDDFIYNTRPIRLVFGFEK
tara:strand:+ start:43 stop:792 length:750 start_codon:yes stop_codon:yes gene_type:complete